jgi:hypothetical protein
MHCGRYFEQSDDPDDDYAAGIDQSTDVTGDAMYDDGSTGGAGDSTGFDLSSVFPWSDSAGASASAESDPTAGGNATVGSDTTGTTGTTGATDTTVTTDESKGLLDPEGLADNALTLVVAIFGGLLIGFVSLFAFMFSPGGLGLLLAVVAWLGSTVYLASRHTVFGAVRYGAYALAGLLVVMPVGVALAAGGSTLERLVLLVMFTVPLGVVAIVVGAVGYLVGLGAPDETDPGL